MTVNSSRNSGANWVICKSDIDTQWSAFGICNDNAFGLTKSSEVARRLGFAGPVAARVPNPVNNCGILYMPHYIRPKILFADDLYCCKFYRNFAASKIRKTCVGPPEPEYLPDLQSNFAQWPPYCHLQYMFGCLGIRRHAERFQPQWPSRGGERSDGGLRCWV